MEKDFSIIMSTFNAAATLPECLASIRSQDSRECEVLVVDGGSTDGTQQILRDNQDLFAHLIMEPDKGIYDAWNKVIDKCNGEWILFLGADDQLKDHSVLSNLKKEVSRNATPQTMYCYGQVDLVDGNSVIDRFGEDSFPNQKKRILKPRPFSHTGLLHHHSLFTKFGKFDATYRIAGDSEFLIRTLKHAEVEVLKMDLDVAIMGHGGISTSVDSRLVAYLEDMRALRTHGHIIPPWHILSKASRAALAYYISQIFGPKFALTVCNSYRKLVGKNQRNKI